MLKRGSSISLLLLLLLFQHDILFATWLFLVANCTLIVQKKLGFRVTFSDRRGVSDSNCKNVVEFLRSERG